MKTRDAISLCHTDFRLAVGISEMLRFRFGMDYNQSLAWVRERNDNITPEKWEALMYEADYYGPEIYVNTRPTGIGG